MKCKACNQPLPELIDKQDGVLVMRSHNGAGLKFLLRADGIEMHVGMSVGCCLSTNQVNALVRWLKDEGFSGWKKGGEERRRRGDDEASDL